MLNNKGFDLWANDYDRTVGLSDESGAYPFAGYKQILNAIYNRVLSAGCRTVLDIGFGTGTLTAKLYERGLAVFGQDFSEKMIALAREKMPNAALIQADFSLGLAPELKQNRYDAILATYSLHHLTDARKRAFLRALRGCLKEDGQILIGDVMFQTRAELDTCKRDAGEEWDDDEIYFVADEFAQAFPRLVFTPVSHCAGILAFDRSALDSEIV